ncbi:MAG TPA: carboxylating nicotinate-nucleotide diphosphorylase [Candidatus Omnitrophota bacterium]|nr:carboxylating nicotinate-nucleotide diphosphorylase [Candidatus Omnitrophota bacterium]
MKYLNLNLVHKLVKNAIREDLGDKDWTTDIFVSRKLEGQALIVSREPGVVAGLPMVRDVFGYVSRAIRVDFLKPDGSRIKADTPIAKVAGPLHSILKGERVALNFLGHLSGIASKTRQFVDQVKPYPVKIMDTRKTLPLLRVLEKYAVRCGGGFNHRMNLTEAIMIKDNHLEAVDYNWKRIANRLKKVRGKEIIIEIDRLEMLEKGIELAPDVILLDNMTVEQVKAAVAKVRASKKKIQIEISGRVTLTTVRDYAKTGADRISVGAITHSAPRFDFSLEMSPRRK